MSLHNLLNVLVQIANKMGLQKKISVMGPFFGIPVLKFRGLLGGCAASILENGAVGYCSAREKLNIENLVWWMEHTDGQP
jgi:hypothetical protein